MKNFLPLLFGSFLLSGCLSYRTSNYDIDVTANVPSAPAQTLSVCASVSYWNASLMGSGSRIAVKTICEPGTTDAKGALTVHFVGKVSDWADSLATSWHANSTANVSDVKFFIRKSRSSGVVLPKQIDISRMRRLDRYVDGSVKLNF